MREVIARRKEGLITIYVISIVLGVLCLLISAIFLMLRPSSSVFACLLALFIVGIVLIPVCVVYIVRISNTPEEIIVYENGVLHFPNCTCRLSEIRNVEYRFARGRRLSYSWGNITIILEDRALKFDFVADVVDVHNRLIQLMLESKGRA